LGFTVALHHFYARSQFFARHIGDAQPAVGNLPATVLQQQPGPVRQRLHLRARDDQFHAQSACADACLAGRQGPLLNDEILPQAVHAHAVFFGNSWPYEAGEIVRHLHRASAREQVV